jgi:hypothetical protein
MPERKRVTSLRISEYTAAQVHQLGDILQASQSEIIMLAIDRMYRQEFGKRNPTKQETQTMNEEQETTLPADWNDRVNWLRQAVSDVPNAPINVDDVEYYIDNEFVGPTNELDDDDKRFLRREFERQYNVG